MFPRQIEVGASVMLMAGLGVGHLALGLAFVASSLPPVAIGVALAGLAGHAGLSWRRWQGQAAVQLTLRQDGSLGVAERGEEPRDAVPTADCRVFSWAVWLGWRAADDGGGAGGHRVLMIPRDALPPADWRALRVWLNLCVGRAGRDVGS